MGCTAIEDKLQEGVPEAIESLAKAGISIWVLTGDKQDTAINIGMACSLLSTDMTQYVVSLEALVKEFEGRTNTKEVADAALRQVRTQLAEVKAAILTARSSGPSPAGLIIDGFGLTFAMTEELQPLFMELGEMCEAVICCRVSPLQKALVTGMVRRSGKTTLAIGDGANDVGMIQSAHIGVGISGQEGMQAVMASDFAIAQFRFLETLVLIHGRYNYRRITHMVTYFFYKNVLFGFSIFWFNAFTFFSGQTCYNDYAMSSFNLFFTSLPVITVAVLDQARPVRPCPVRQSTSPPVHQSARPPAPHPLPPRTCLPPWLVAFPASTARASATRRSACRPSPTGRSTDCTSPSPSSSPSFGDSTACTATGRTGS